MWSDADVERRILTRLDTGKYWGGRHTAIEHLQSGFPSHERGHAKQIALALLGRGWLVRKPTFYGLHVSLNVAHRAEILALIKPSSQPNVK